MRCPSCGTDNEPDSRFCGGCGARLATESRIAPTQKIDTGAQPVQATPPPEVRIPSSRPPDSRPPRGISGSQNVPPASFPLTPSVQRPPQSRPQPVQPAFPPSNGVSPPGTSQQPLASRSRDAAESAPPPRKRTGLIITLLLVDLALAGAGAYLLVEGLSSAPAAPAPAAKPSAALGAPTGTVANTTPPRAVGTPPPDAAPPPADAAPSAPTAAPPRDAALVVTPIPEDAAVAPPDAAPAKKPATQSRKKATERKKTTQPLDPYDDPDGPSDPFPPDLPPPPPPPSEP